MLINNFKSQVRYLYPELKAILTNNLPKFVISNNSNIEKEIIVFSFHTPDPSLFNKQMQYLYENNYKTITTDDLHNFILYSKNIPQKCIMLTFDDCRASVWTTVYPILKKYNFKGVSYLNPYCISQTNGNAKRAQWNMNMDDNCKDQCIEVDKSENPFSSWEEILQMHNSKVIDFQGHAYYHEQVFVSSKIIDFLNPKTNRDFAGFNVPVIWDNNRNRYDRKLPFGTPLYEKAPRMSGKLRYYDDEDLRKHCVNFVKKHGNEQFFNNFFWRNRLRKEVKKYLNSHDNNSYYESHEAMEKYLREDFVNTKNIIESNLPGKGIDSMCFPWEVGSNIATKLARETGYKSCVWGIVPGIKSNFANSNPYQICRLSSDFIFRLPGRHRISFAKLVAWKFLKRFTKLVK